MQIAKCYSPVSSPSPTLYQSFSHCVCVVWWSFIRSTFQDAGWSCVARTRLTNVKCIGCGELYKLHGHFKTWPTHIYVAATSFFEITCFAQCLYIHDFLQIRNQTKVYTNLCICIVIISLSIYISIERYRHFADSIMNSKPDSKYTHTQTNTFPNRNVHFSQYVWLSIYFPPQSSAHTWGERRAHINALRVCHWIKGNTHGVCYKYTKRHDPLVTRC